MVITASAPSPAASRARSSVSPAVRAQTPTTTGTCPFFPARSCSSTAIRATVRRSWGSRVLNSLALTGVTTPWAPASKQKASTRRRESSSRAPSGVKGVTGMVNSPRWRVAVISRWALP